ncbi:MAG TPA: DUF3108 domain-containing protein [Usitatibacter sp.]|nr:DUF3108 domain-containing protein [Usitatibacter sp.]
MKRALAALAVCAVTVASAAAATPMEITARYDLSHPLFGTIARVDESFQRRGDEYSIRSVTTSEGALKIVFDEQLVLESSGRVNDEGLQPLRFSQRRAKSNKSDVSATFDWARGLMHSARNGEVKEVPLPPRTQDRISVMYQFMNMPAGTDRVSMNMSNGRKVDLYTYRLVDEEKVRTPAGAFDTLHYQRVTTDPKESHADVWLAKDRFNFPVRVVFDDPKGLRLEQTLVGLESH